MIEKWAWPDSLTEAAYESTVVTITSSYYYKFKYILMALMPNRFMINTKHQRYKPQQLCKKYLCGFKHYFHSSARDGRVNRKVAHQRKHFRYDFNLNSLCL